MGFQDTTPSFGEDPAVLGVKKWTKLIANGGGRDAIGRLFDLYSCLVMSDMQDNKQWTLSSGDITKQVSLAPRAMVNDFVTLRRMVSDGGGIAILPIYLHTGDYYKRLVRVLGDWMAPPIEFHAVLPGHRGATSKVRAFLDFLIVRLSHRFDDSL